MDTHVHFCQIDFCLVVWQIPVKHFKKLWNCFSQGLCVPFYIPTCFTLTGQFLHIITNSWYGHFWVIKKGVQRCLMILVCIFLMTNDSDHLFMCILAYIGFISFWLNIYLKLCPIKKKKRSLLLIIRDGCIFWALSHNQIYVWMFSSSLWLVFHFWGVSSVV